jgi:uncharacterized protein (TIGR00725 family)
MRRKPLIFVSGSDGEIPEKIQKMAYEVGKEVAERGRILVTGGLDGVMEAASKGAKENGGFVIGIIPQAEPSYANEYCDAVVASGFGYARNFLLINSCDACIVVAGGEGTRMEAMYTKKLGKPVIALKGSGETADEIDVVKASNPKEAVKKALKNG